MYKYKGVNFIPEILRELYLDRENGFYRKKSTVGFGSQKTIVLLDNALDDL